MGARFRAVRALLLLCQSVIFGLNGQLLDQVFDPSFRVSKVLVSRVGDTVLGIALRRVEKYGTNFVTLPC